LPGPHFNSVVSPRNRERVRSRREGGKNKKSRNKGFVSKLDSRHRKFVQVAIARLTEGMEAKRVERGTRGGERKVIKEEMASPLQLSI